MTRRKNTLRRSRFESLEPRTMMAGDIDFDGDTGVLTIEGGPYDDRAYVGFDHDNGPFQEFRIRLEAGEADGTPDVTTRSVDVDQVTKIVFLGGDGNDHFNTDAPESRFPIQVSAKIELFGGAGNDNLAEHLSAGRLIDGGPGNDFLSTSGQGAVVDGGAGADFLVGGLDGQLLGGDGDDEILHVGGFVNAGAGNDTVAPADPLLPFPVTVYGGPGNDRLHGSNAADRLQGDAGNDRLYGLDGNDTLIGGSGGDVLYGGNGHDRLYGNDGNDVLYGGRDHDLLFGGAGIDHLYGQHGNDSMYGQGGEDYLTGGSGDDYLDGGNDGVADHLKGQSGRDTFVAEYGFYIGSGRWRRWIATEIEDVIDAMAEDTLVRRNILTGPGAVGQVALMGP